MTDYLNQIKWNADGLIPVIAQDATSNRILMLAWLNEEALKTAVAESRAVYWSRSRGKLWRKGEESGHIQKLIGIYLDCDNDCICYKVEQVGGIACHTGRESCFFKKLEADNWQNVDPVLKQADEIYQK
jgi:phosphoribosyl-AMP cyclohydrolase|tara:strand:- start:2074 stop:2460 length:387 start_codon:yes stop_codon:yes gene_type:complete